MNKPQELTERIWINIKEPIIAIMDDLHRKRLQREHNETLKKRLNILTDLVKEYTSEQPINAVIPGFGDICNMTDFSNILLGPADDIKVTSDDFEEAMKRLPQLIEDWRVAKESELVSLMLEPVSDSINIQATDHNTSLQLARAHFHCKKCHQVISYPRVLVHQCLVDYRVWEHASDIDGDAKVMWSHQGKAPWDNSNAILSFGGKIQTRIKRLLEISNLDPDSTTAQEMDEKGLMFECTDCHSEYSGACIMGWRTAVQSRFAFNNNQS